MGVEFGSTLFVTSVLDGVGSQRHAPAALTPGKRSDINCTGHLSGPQSRFREARKISSQPGFDLRTVQPAASRYTD